MKFTKKNLTRISELDYLIIENVKSLRIGRNMSRQQLSEKMGVANSFVGKVENLSFRDKYNIRHLTLIAKAFGLATVKDLIPSDIPDNDMIEITYEKVSKVNDSGVIGKQTEDKVISIKAVKKNK